MFNDNYGLTKAVLEGRKTMTRRIVPECKELNTLRYWEHNEGAIATGYEEKTHSFRFDYCPDKKRRISIDHLNLIPSYKVGEVVAVAQNYNVVFDEFATIVYTQGKPVPDNFKAFGSHSYATLPRTMPGWDNKMFIRADLMPHQLRITNVRIERLQDISDEDCIKEGIERDEEVYAFNDYEGYKTPRLAFAALINRISGKGTWESNPWVYVYEFELLK